MVFEELDELDDCGVLEALGVLDDCAVLQSPKGTLAEEEYPMVVM